MSCLLSHFEFETVPLPLFPFCELDIFEASRPVVLQNVLHFGFIWSFPHDYIQVKLLGIVVLSVLHQGALDVLVSLTM